MRFIFRSQLIIFNKPAHEHFVGNIYFFNSGKCAKNPIPNTRSNSIIHFGVMKMMVKMMFSRPAPIKIPRCVGVEAAVEHLIRGVTYDKANAKRKAMGEAEEPDGEGGDDGEGDEGADDLFEGGGEVVNSRMML